MRESKFRAYGVFRPHFGNPVYEMRNDVIVKDGRCFVYELDFASGIAGKPCLTERSADLMQYTGLKDKNGMEIYESDLVKTEKGIFQLTIDCFGPELSGYDNGDYYYGYVSEYHNWNEFEVIGNIYENPDLLEEE